MSIVRRGRLSKLRRVAAAAWWLAGALLASAGGAVPSITALLEARDGSLWVGARYGLYRIGIGA